MLRSLTDYLSSACQGLQLSLFLRGLSAENIDQEAVDRLKHKNLLMASL